MILNWTKKIHYLYFINSSRSEKILDVKIPGSSSTGVKESEIQM